MVFLFCYTFCPIFGLTFVILGNFSKSLLYLRLLYFGIFRLFCYTLLVILGLKIKITRELSNFFVILRFVILAFKSITKNRYNKKSASITKKSVV